MCRSLFQLLLLALLTTFWNQVFFLRVSGGSDKIRKALKPFGVFDVRGPQVFQAVRSAKDVTIEDYLNGRLFRIATDAFGCI